MIITSPLCNSHLFPAVGLSPSQCTLSHQQFPSKNSSRDNGGHRQPSKSLFTVERIPLLRSERIITHQRSTVAHSWLTTSQIASSAFSIGTVAVLPFYTMMIASPKSETTRNMMKSALPYMILGLAYAFLLYLSWTRDTIRLMFASKYWLPELSGIAKMFASEMTLASAWIHLLAVDLFAARHVYLDGIENGVETRHSISCCLLFCPVGILCHYITTALTKRIDNSKKCCI